MKNIKDEREILGEGENGNITINERLSLSHCRKVLNRNGNQYTDEEIIAIRDFLYIMATLDYRFFTEQYLKNNPTIINLNPPNHEESIPLHQGEYRRAG